MSGANSFHILIADDNVVNRRVLHDLLKMRGYSVHAVDDGLEVLEALKAEAFDLVILDCLMPGMDGYTTCRTIRSADPALMNPAVPVLAVTALTSKTDRRKCFEAGMNDYISKPILANILYQRVEDLLLHHRPAGGKDAAAGDDEAASGAAGNLEAEQAHQVARNIFASLAPVLDRDIVRWQSELKARLEQNAQEELRLLAHKIRGTADLSDCHELSQLAARLERAAGARRETDVTTLVPALIASLQRLRKQLRVKG